MNNKNKRIFKLFIEGHYPKYIAKKVGLQPYDVSVILRSNDLKIRIKNTEDMIEKRNDGWDSWNEYLLSPDRKRFLRLAKNGLWVEYFIKNFKHNKRLGRTYLSQIEKEIHKKKEEEND